MTGTKKLWARRGIAGLAAALALITGTAAASFAGTAPSAPEPRLSGSAGGVLTKAFGSWAGDPVKFQIEARGGPGTTKGRFQVFHGNSRTGGVVAEFEGKITCLLVGGEVAVATGVITRGQANLTNDKNTDVTGQKVSFTVHDDGRSDRLYWMWGFMNAPINDCQGTAPILKTSHGNFKVRD
ncbi:hypothetical protein [Nonomuraea sp. NPDC049725]|uniref:hypothetical protein n=1 Tax=Nonomuraea sp. NPDC049725 TaxID=3154508 RepID=UPI00344642FF